jgi:chitinase
MIGHGFTLYWDAKASAPYLYSESQKIFVSYDDGESVARKCSYVLAHRLGGVMFWEYSDDPIGVLVGTIAHALHASTPAPH